LESLKIAYRGDDAPIETEWIPSETLK